MTFLHPLGLLGLIAVPVIVAIHIILSKYTEQTIPSTYLWQLSNKFLKKRNPLSGITGIISLVLQLLTVIVISLAIAHPVFVLPNSAKSYCFVLDSSSSMLTVDKRESRFEMAKDEIIDVINSSKNGSSYTLIKVAGDNATVFENVDSKKRAKEYVNSLECESTAVSDSELKSAAQNAFDNAPGSVIYLITDRDYSLHTNLNLINVGRDNTENLAILSSSYSHSGGRLKVLCEVISYSADKHTEVALYVGGSRAQVKSVSLSAGEPSTVDFDIAAASWSSFRLSIEDKDAYSADNEKTVYNLESDKSYSVLIVSENGFFLKAAIDSLVNSAIDVITPEEYAINTKSYGLYIFDSYEPSELPDGSVWLINAGENIEGAGFGIRGVAETDGMPISKSKSTATATKKLLSGVKDSDIYVKNFIKYSGFYLDFNTLYSYDSYPVIFAGANEKGRRQVVFGFDIHESDIALSSDFVVLIGNLLDYSFPNVIDSTEYTVGDEILVNLVAGAKNPKAEAPSEKEIYLVGDGAEATLTLDEIGTYKISLIIAGEEISYYLYSSPDISESEPRTAAADLSLSGEAQEINTDGIFDPITLLFVALAILFILDWGLYCYEKYQLR